MEGFSKIDIFDTKGIEYIFVIGYLLILIVFWNVANRQKILKQVKSAIQNLSAGLLRIPQGLYYNKAHTWTHLDASGEASVGLDDFLQHITGKIQFANLKETGHEIKKGDLLTEIDQDGKKLRLYSPISGEIISTNPVLYEIPEIINEDPYGKGWIYKIKPTNWIEETSNYLLAEEATTWSRNEMDRFKEFVIGGPMRKFSSEPAMMVLQDGGELRDHILSDLPKEVWEDFQSEFLNMA